MRKQIVISGINNHGFSKSHVGLSQKFYLYVEEATAFSLGNATIDYQIIPHHTYPIAKGTITQGTKTAEFSSPGFVDASPFAAFIKQQNT